MNYYSDGGEHLEEAGMRTTGLDYNESDENASVRPSMWIKSNQNLSKGGQP